MQVSKETDKNQYQPKITAERIRHIFRYGEIEGSSGCGSNELGDRKVGASIIWQKDSFSQKAYQDIQEQIVPQHIKWYNNPVFAFVSIVDEKVQYHYSENGGFAVFLCPITTDMEQIQLIDEIFEHYYQKFNLPDSLKQVKTVQSKSDKSDKMKFLTEYLRTGDEDFFNDNFCEDQDIYDIAMWINWREEDENIINYCEEIIQTNQLSVETIDTDDELGFQTIITYKSKKITIPYKGSEADRNTTIQTLNNILQPDYEIRLCKQSLGSDTLCFIPLSAEQWSELDTKLPQETKQKFLKITKETVMFE